MSLLGLLQEREGEGVSQATQEQGAGAQIKGKRIPRSWELMKGLLNQKLSVNLELTHKRILIFFQGPQERTEKEFSLEVGCK